MSDSLYFPLICPVMVGREQASTALFQLLDSALAGNGKTVLISGEAGIGKSRLISESARYASAHGMRVLTGQCFEPDRTFPYSPIVDLLRTARLMPAQTAGLDDETYQAAIDVAALLPESSPSRANQFLGADARQVFLAISRLLATLAKQSPLLLVLEDIHWSDETTLDLFVQLARAHRKDCPIAIVATFRGNELTNELTQTLAALDRERLCTEIRLEPLARTDVTAMIAAMSPTIEPVSPDLLDAIVALSDGNPFFVEELLRAVVFPPEGALRQGLQNAPTPFPLPRNVESAVCRRLDRLSEGARRTVTLAAVSGRRFDFALIEAVGERDERQLLDDLKELISEQLVYEESADTFAFRHALVRQAIYNDLLARERRTLHRQLLETLLRIGPESTMHHAADVARHAVATGAWQEALDYGQRAGARALAHYAPQAAIEHFGHSLEAADHLGYARRSGIFRSRGTAQESLGRFDPARRDYEAAIAAAQANGDLVEETESLLALGQLWAGRDYSRSGTYFQEAMQHARSTGDRSLLASVLNRVGNWHVNIEQPAMAFPLHDEALAIFEAANDVPGIAATLDLIAMAQYLAGDGIASAVAGRRAVSYLREIDDRPRLLSALAMLAIVSGSSGSKTIEFANAPHPPERLVDEAIAISREINWLPGETFTLGLAATVLANAKPTLAFERAQDAIRIADEIEHRQWQSSAYDALARLLFRMLDVRAAQEAFQHALNLAESVGSLFWIHNTSSSLAMCLIEEGKLDQASALIEKRLDRDATIVTMCQGELWLAQARLELARDRPEQALAIVDRLATIRFAGRDIDLTRVPYIAHIRGDALSSLHHGEEALDAFAAALEGATQTSDRPLIWNVQLSLAAFYRARDVRSESNNARTAARAAFDSFAADLYDEAMRTAFLERARSLLPSEPVLSPRRAAKLAFGGLTERERDVAILVAAGNSNREIGTALFTSERTAATHVSNILGKLGLKTRAQIATWALEHGLAGSPER